MAASSGRDVPGSRSASAPVVSAWSRSANSASILSSSTSPPQLRNQDRAYPDPTPLQLPRSSDRNIGAEQARLRTAVHYARASASHEVRSFVNPEHHARGETEAALSSSHVGAPVLVE